MKGNRPSMEMVEECSRQSGEHGVSHPSHPPPGHHRHAEAEGHQKNQSGSRDGCGLNGTIRAHKLLKYS